MFGPSEARRDPELREGRQGKLEANKEEAILLPRHDGRRIYADASVARAQVYIYVHIYAYMYVDMCAWQGRS